MDYAYLSERPAKRKRFFADGPIDDGIQINEPSSSGHETESSKRQHEPVGFFPDTDNGDIGIESDPFEISQPLSLPNRLPLLEQPVDVATLRNHDSSDVKFDPEAFESFLGDRVSPEVLDIIRDNCDNNLERAMNMYFDGTWKNFKKSPSLGAFADRMTARPPPTPKTEPENCLGPGPVARRSMSGSRYIGAFGVEGWATRSGTNLLKHGDVVKVERQKIQPRQPPKPKGKLGMQVNSTRVSPAMSRRVDVVVRFTTANGMEIGRLAKDNANWVSTLMDQKICSFEGTCVYAPERLRTNDTVLLQLKCSLLASAFHDRGFTLADDRAVGLFEEKETAEEKELRLRQVAIVRLFQEINLIPTKVNAAAAKNRRQGLLQAAEMAEKKEKEPHKTTTNNIK
jgi:DNA repair protein RAD5